MQQRTSDWCLFIFLSPRSDCCSCDWLRPAFSVRSHESRPAWKTVTPSDQTWGFGDKNAGAAELRVPEEFLAARRPPRPIHCEHCLRAATRKPHWNVSSSSLSLAKRSSLLAPLQPAHGHFCGSKFTWWETGFDLHFFGFSSRLVYQNGRA